MGHSRFLLTSILSLFLATGFLLIGCGDDEGGTVTVELGQLCAESLQALNSQGCEDNAYANVDDLKVCVSGCGPADQQCLDGCFAVPGSGFSACSGDVELLFTGQCGDCFADCGFDFVGDETDPGCLFDPNPATSGADCLDDLYGCVNTC